MLAKYPYIGELLASVKIGVPDASMTAAELLTSVPDEYYEDFALSRAQMAENMLTYIEEMETTAAEDRLAVRTVTVLGGHDKSGRAENCTLTLTRGDVVCIVGPTGAGKSRLLADIECMAQRDTPTGRQVLINGGVPEEKYRFEIEHKLVAQLSQNMNFVMDLSVTDFVALHAQSRMVQDEAEAARRILDCANDLAGEQFSGQTALTQLSGGQSRALMIASTALLSRSPIVLIDEIENAGIDRQKALQLLVREEKIVMMSTHDPILALLGDRRVAIKNGGIAGIVETGEEERANLSYLEKIDAGLSDLRGRIRRGEKIDFDLHPLFE
ncbi:ATP-binding cassette domain-containing protein [Ethanoligenens harbinense]|nr:ABC transporter [Ethanoligenens harbinense YUAN-3]AYF40124.1 ABC transporter [Ethanoligenens harbinense]AYF42964.1 ABC transporter [Ethanoligenens harbinense]QCN93722.1 ATP-binding cassette domain-containing protein [Ethanoligenens harbinense]